MKSYRIAESNVLDLVSGKGLCFASDRITVDGERVGFMFRDRPNSRLSGWCFLSGDESSSYLDDPQNFSKVEVNFVANYDPDIIPFLDSDVGATFQRQSRKKPLAPVNSVGS